MADIITRLLLKTNDFDANLSKAKGSVNGFQEKVAGMAKTAGTGIVKFAGAVGVAVTAAEGFNRVINSSQTLGDEYNRTIDGLKGGVDQFFYSIGSGDWTPFMNGLNETIRLAREAYDAMDQLGNTRMSYSYFDAKNQATVQEQISILKDKDSTDEQKEAAKKILDETLKDQQEIVDQYKRRSVNAIQAMVKAAIGIDGVDVSTIDIDKVIRLDVSSAGDEEKAELAKQYKEFEQEYSRIKAKYTTYQTIGSGMNMHMTPIVDTKAIGDAISPILTKYQDAIKYNAILVKKNDEWLKELIGVSTAAEMADRNLSSMTKSANRAGQALNIKKDVPVSGSLEWFDSEISKKNKELIRATNAQAREAIQATINELEKQKIQLQIMEGDGSLDAISLQISSLKKKYASATTDEARKEIYNLISELESKQLHINLTAKFNEEKAPLKKAGFNYTETKKLKLPTTLQKIETPIKKKDIDLNEEYNKTLSAMGSIMGDLTGMFDGSTASILQWGSTLLNTIAQAIPAILSMVPAKKADAAASNESATASTVNAAAETLEAHAGIPFAGIAIGLAGVASIVAAMASIPKFATGGIVPGISFSGDKVPALLNSGEMILNGTQQSNLFKMLNGGQNYNEVKPLSLNLGSFIKPEKSNSEVKVTGDFRVRGCDLELVLKNQNSKKSKVR